MKFIKLHLNKFVILFLISLIVTLFMAWEPIKKELRHPETEIMGSWDEVAWNYDKVNKLKGSSAILKGNLKNELKNQISKDLIIHKAEKWQFLKNGQLILVKKDRKNEIVKWRLKGRGHILKLEHNSGEIEYYQIHKLSENKLVLHFENDNHARGIVKIIFKKRI